MFLVFNNWNMTESAWNLIAVRETKEEAIALAANYVKNSGLDDDLEGWIDVNGILDDHFLVVELCEAYKPCFRVSLCEAGDWSFIRTEEDVTGLKILE